MSVSGANEEMAVIPTVKDLSSVMLSEAKHLGLFASYMSA